MTKESDFFGYKDIQQNVGRYIDVAKYHQLISWEATVSTYLRDLRLRRRLTLLNIVDEYVILLSNIIRQYQNKLPAPLIATCAQITSELLILRLVDFDETKLEETLQASITTLESIELALPSKDWLGIEYITKPSVHAKKYLDNIYTMNLLPADYIKYIMPQIIALLHKQLALFVKNNDAYNYYKKIIKDIQSASSIEEAQVKINSSVELCNVDYLDISTSLSCVKQEMIKKGIIPDVDSDIAGVGYLLKNIQIKIDLLEEENTAVKKHVINVVTDQVNIFQAKSKLSKHQSALIESFKSGLEVISVSQDPDEFRVKVSAFFEDERKCLQQSGIVEQSSKIKSENKKVVNILGNAKAILISDRTLANDYINNQRAIVILRIKEAIEHYQSSSYMPIGYHRAGIDGEGGQKLQLIDELEQTKTSVQAAKCIAKIINIIKGEHEGNSIPASIVLIEKQSRMANALQSAQEDLVSKQLLPSLREPDFITVIKRHLEEYKNEDIFFHNRNRLRKANQLLLDLVDLHAADDKDLLEKGEGIKDKLEACIDSIHHDYLKGYFAWISNYLWNSQSRLVTHLRAAQMQLTKAKLIPQYSYHEFVRPIIRDHLIIISNNLKDSFIFPAGSDKQEIDTFTSDLIREINSAATPIAAEAILKTSIINLQLAAKDSLYDRYRHDFSKKLITLLNVLQQAELLTVSSEFAAFLNSMGQQAQNIKNDRLKLEQEMGIQLPSTPVQMGKYAAFIKDKAEGLKKRSLNLG